MAQGVSSIPLPITTSSPSLSSLAPLHIQSGFATVLGPYCNPTSSANAKLSKWWSCSSTLSASPKANRAGDTLTFFSNLSSSSRFLTCTSVPGWALAMVEPVLHRSTALVQCALCGSSNKLVKPASIAGASLCSSGCPQASDTQGHPSPQRGGWPTRAFRHGSIPFSSVSWLAHLLLVCKLQSFLRCNQNWPHTQMARKDWRKRQPTPDWKVGGLISKGTYIRGLWWAVSSQVDHLTCLPEP